MSTQPGAYVFDRLLESKKASIVLEYTSSTSPQADLIRTSLTTEDLCFMTAHLDFLSLVEKRRQTDRDAAVQTSQLEMLKEEGWVVFDSPNSDFFRCISSRDTRRPYARLKGPLNGSRLGSERPPVALQYHTSFSNETVQCRTE